MSDTLTDKLAAAIERDDAVLGRGRLRGGIQRQDRSVGAMVQHIGVTYEAYDGETTLYVGSSALDAAKAMLRRWSRIREEALIAYRTPKVDDIGPTYRSKEDVADSHGISVATLDEWLRADTNP